MRMSLIPRGNERLFSAHNVELQSIAYEHNWLTLENTYKVLQSNLTQGLL